MNEEKKLEKLYNKLNDEYLGIVQYILSNEEFKKRIEYNHHENRSVYTHSLLVSFHSYKVAKILKLDYESAAIGGLLHDFYYNDWQKNPKKGLKNMHGFVHAYEALENSRKIFPEYMTDKISDIIVKHMFPLNIRPPKYAESWIITCVDKIVSLEILATPKQLYKYVGLAFVFNIFKIRLK
jgi:uncharacterized protein